MVRFIEKWWITLLLVFLTYVGYSYLILKPQLLNNFSLVDDGQSIQNSQFFNDCFKNYDCSDLKNVLVEKNFGRFRPFYWFIHFLNYELLGLSASLHHLLRVYGVGLFIMILLSFTVISAGGNSLGVITSALLLMSSFSFTENILRLGPVEPYQIMAISLFSSFFLANNEKFYKLKNFSYLLILTLLLLAAITIKETSIVMVFPIIFVGLYGSDWKFSKKIPLWLSFCAVLITVLGRLLTKTHGGDLAYAENFNLSFSLFFDNATIYYQIITNSFTLYAKSILVVVPILYMLTKSRKVYITKHVTYWFILFLFSVVLLLPWKYALERYVLLSLFSLSVIIGIFASKLLDLVNKLFLKMKLKKGYVLIIYFVLGVLWSNLFFRNMSLNLAKSLNYVSWYKNYLKFEADQVNAISKHEGSEVYINAVDNINNWEILYEIPIHLKLIKNSDVKVGLIGSELPGSGYIFTRVPFDLGINMDLLQSFSIVEEATYEIDQINALSFKDDFLLKPLQTINNPPYLKEKIYYHWEVRKI